MSSSLMPRCACAALAGCCRVRRPDGTVPGAFGQEVGHDGIRPVGDGAGHHVGETLAEREGTGGYIAVAGVTGRVVGVTTLDRRRWGAVTPPPLLYLGIAVLGRGLLLVESLQRPVVTLVETPVPSHRQPAPAGRVEGEVRGPDRPRQYRRMDDPQVEVALGGEQFPAIRASSTPSAERSTSYHR